MYYFDWTATTPISKKALSAYCDASISFIGNPSSNHVLGYKAKEKLEEERSIISKLLAIDPSTLYFTSGGTEADSIILNSLLLSPSKGEIIASAIEHSAILEHKKTLENNGWKFTLLNCPNGYLDPEKLKNALNEKVRMVTFMKVNNVTGTILDTKALVNIVRSYSKSIGRNIHIHCDAVQALGKIPFNIALEDFDSCAFSSHKFYGPRGIGMLYCKNKALNVLSRGGGQEKGLRPGTENLSAICAMRVALEDALENLEENYQKVLSFRKTIEETSLSLNFQMLSPRSDSNLSFSPYIINISTKALPSEVFLRIMSDKGFCLSAGSACSSNSKTKAESVLSAMGFDSIQRRGSIRISLGKDNTSEEVSLLCNALKEISKEY